MVTCRADITYYDVDVDIGNIGDGRTRAAGVGGCSMHMIESLAHIENRVVHGG
jgi:hypothetical protein